MPLGTAKIKLFSNTFPWITIKLSLISLLIVNCTFQLWTLLLPKLTFFSIDGLTKLSKAPLKRFFHYLQSSEQSTSRMDALNRLTDLRVAHLFKKCHRFWCAFNSNCGWWLKPKKPFHLRQHLLSITISLEVLHNKKKVYPVIEIFIVRIIADVYLLWTTRGDTYNIWCNRFEDTVKK